MAEYRFRPATVEDVPAIAALESVSQAYPWTESQIQAALCDDVWVASSATGGCIAWLAMRSVLDEAEVLNLAVAPSERRRGVARALIEFALGRLEAAGTAQVFLEVRGSNRAAQALYTQLGFAPCGLRLDYYRNGDGREDALVMRRQKSQGPAA